MGINIHPGANIDASFFIDHGTGIVIADDVTIGSSVFLMDDVPSHMKATIGKPILDMKRKNNIWIKTR